MMRPGLFVVLLSCGLHACDGLVDFRIDWLSISTSQGANIGIRFTWGNRSGRTLYVDGCRSLLERRSAAGWQIHAAGDCATRPDGALTPIELSPGARLTDTTFAHLTLLPGDYRGVFFVRTAPDHGNWQAVYSSMFRIER